MYKYVFILDLQTAWTWRWRFAAKVAKVAASCWQCTPTGVVVRADNSVLLLTLAAVKDELSGSTVAQC